MDVPVFRLLQFTLNAYGLHIVKREPPVGMGDFDYRQPEAMEEYLKKRKAAP